MIKLYKSKFAVLFIAMVLALGLALPACTCGEVAPPAEEPAAEEPAAEEPAAEEPAAAEPAAEEPAAEEPAAGELSFEAAEYANADYGFSVKYPADWPEQEVEAPTLFSATPGMVPVLMVSIRDGATFADAFAASIEAAGGSGLNILSEKEVTLADGSTPAVEIVADAKVSGFDAKTFGLGVKIDDGWLGITITTVDLMAPYDEALFSEIAYSLQF